MDGSVIIYLNLGKERACMAETKKLVIVEDQRLFQDLLTQVAIFQGFTIVGVAGDGLSALELCLQRKPDLLLLDLLIPKMAGLVVAASLRERGLLPRILAVSSETDAYTLHRVFEIGLEGFIDKGSQNLQTLQEAIRKVGAGERYFSPRILHLQREYAARPDSFVKLLSTREQEVLSLVGACFSDGEIGERLGLSASTVQTHRRNIMQKLGMHTTPELIKYSLQHGFWKHQAQHLEDGLE